MTDLAFGDVGFAYNVTLESEKRSNAAEAVVREAEKTLNKSMDSRNKMEKEVVNAKPRLDEMHVRNEKMLGNLTSQLAMLQKMLNMTNQMLCGSGESCGGCTPKGCSMCGGATCTGTKNLAITALKIAKEAEEAMRKKEGKCCFKPWFSINVIKHNNLVSQKNA